MRVLSWHNVSWPAKALIATISLFLIAIAAFGLQSGILAVSAVSLVILLVFLLTAPFVFSGRWRKPEPISTRRPVYRKRRA
jgi:hypothetical protein